MNAQDKNGSYGLVIEPDAITRVNTMLTHMSHFGTFTGSVLIALDGRILLSHGYGFADRAQGIPNTPRTRFHLGSMTKMFTAMGILILQSQGKLRVIDPICHLISSFPKAWKDITIHHLLTHTSGLSSQQSDRLYREIESAASGPVPLSEQAHYLGLDCEWAVDARPGEQYAYNNFGYILLTHIIEQVSGQSYASFLERAIFAPLQMRNTGYQDKSSGVAKLYPDGDSTTGDEFGSPPISEGSGHLYSTSEDLCLWDQALYTDRLLSQTELNRIFEPYVCETEYPGFGYGYGWFVGESHGRPIVAGAGGGPMFATLIVRYPQDHLTEIVLTNQGKIDHFSIWAAISNQLFRE
jgi:CubicO group peptidase (beta-lactamase class C family)